MSTFPADGLVPSVVSEFEEAMEEVSDTSIHLQEIADLTLIRIEIDPGSAAAKRLEAVTGAKFPARLGEVTGDSLALEVLYGTRQVVSLMKVEEGVFLLATRVDADKLGRAMDRALARDPGLIINVTINRSVVELAGPRAVKVLDHVVDFELNPRTFAPGMAFQGRVLGLPMMIWRIADDQFLLLPREGHVAPFMVGLLDEIEKVK